MSEYYKLRRTKITDGMALLGFVIGLLFNAYAAGTRMGEGFDLGLETEGLTYFVVTVLLSAVVGGVIGLVAGVLGGWVWERLHRFVRSSRSASASGANGAISGVFPATSEGAAQPAMASARGAGGRAISTTSVARVDPAIQFDGGTVDAVGFLTLLRRATPGEYHADRAAAALERTDNIGAWDGDRLVGVVRILSDGYLFATIPEIVVDPDYRRRGIGRELMNRALEKSGTNVILVGSPPAASGFFENLGCQRAPSGYVLRRRVAPTVRTR